MADEQNTEKPVSATRLGDSSERSLPEHEAPNRSREAEAVSGQNDTKQQESDGKTSKPSKNSKFKIQNSKFLLKAGIMAVVVASSAGAGFGLGRLFGGPPAAAPAEAQTEPTGTQAVSETGSTTDSQSSSGGWYYDFEPVVANLNEPGVTRYIRVALTLQISTELDSKKGKALLEEKKPLLRNWLTIYLASQTLEDIRGDKNLRRIQSEILDSFNEKLFTDAKGNIRNVLFKEFTVQ